MRDLGLKGSSLKDASLKNLGRISSGFLVLMRSKFNGLKFKGLDIGV